MDVGSRSDKFGRSRKYIEVEVEVGSGKWEVERGSGSGK